MSRPPVGQFYGKSPTDFGYLFGEKINPVGQFYGKSPTDFGYLFGEKITA
jgi:hypothetical protein